jgi:HYR domain
MRRWLPSSWHWIAVVALATAGLVGVPTSAPFAAGTLNLQESLRLVSVPVVCPPETPPNAYECRGRATTGSVRGLGAVTASYTWFARIGPPTCPSDLGKPLAVTGRISVGAKGELRFSLREGARCVPQEQIRNEPQDFTLTGGAGAYEGASGSGTLTRSVGADGGNERWTGTLVAPGVEFDLSPPMFSGGKSKTVRAPKGAKRVRVIYKVTANDAVDGLVAATCAPRSGGRFRIGRTIVRCSATDSSANAGRASFRVTVKAAR